MTQTIQVSQEDIALLNAQLQAKQDVDISVDEKNGTVEVQYNVPRQIKWVDGVIMVIADIEINYPLRPEDVNVRTIGIVDSDGNKINDYMDDAKIVDDVFNFIWDYFDSSPDWTTIYNLEIDEYAW